MPLPIATPRELHLDEPQLKRAYELLESWTSGDDPEVPAGAILIGRDGRTVEPQFFGRQTPEQPEAVREDGLFLLASITKPVTYLAALQLVEQGRLNLTDPVARYVPAFATHGKRDVRVHHLFTHTSGLPDMLPNNRELRAAHAPPSRFVSEVIENATLAFAPGTNYQYQSMGTLMVAEIIHQLTGQWLDEYLRQNVIEPLGMTSSSLGIGSLDERRIVSVEVPESAKETDWHWNSSYWRNFGAPWGGMFSTPSDLAILCECLLRHGTLNGRTLWSPATIEAATTSRMDDYPDLPESIRRTRRWGLGWQMNAIGSPSAFCELLGPEVFGHTGATGTMLWVDRKRNAFCILLTTAIRAKAPWRLLRLSNMIAAAFR